MDSWLLFGLPAAGTVHDKLQESYMHMYKMQILQEEIGAMQLSPAKSQKIQALKPDDEELVSDSNQVHETDLNQHATQTRTKDTNNRTEVAIEKQETLGYQFFKNSILKQSRIRFLMTNINHQTYQQTKHPQTQDSILNFMK